MSKRITGREIVRRVCPAWRIMADKTRRADSFAVIYLVRCPYIQLARASAHAGPRREGTLGWNRRCIDFAAPTAEQLADGLNAPAFVAAAFLDPLRSRSTSGARNSIIPATQLRRYACRCCGTS